MELKNNIITARCEDILPLLADDSVDVIFTGPPFDGAMMGRDWTLDILWLGKEFSRILKNGGVCLFSTSDKISNGKKSLTSFNTVISWCYNTELGLWTDYVIIRGGQEGFWWSSRPRIDHEFLFVFVKSSNKPKTYKKDPFMMQGKSGKMKCGGSVIDIREWKLKTNRIIKSQKEDLAVPFPEEFALRMLDSFTTKGDFVLDPFCGTGTVPLVATKLGLDYLGIEMREHVAEFARKRLDPSLKGFGFE